MSKSVEQVIRETKERAAAEKAERDAKIKKLADAARAKQAAEAAAQTQRNEAARVEREKKFNEELEREARAAFFRGNPGASETLYQSMREDFRKQVIRDRAEEAKAGRYDHSLYRYR